MMGFEPGTHNRSDRVDDYKSDIYTSEFSNIDIRHNSNLTKNRWNKDQYKSRKYIKGWQEAENVVEWDNKEFNYLKSE